MVISNNYPRDNYLLFNSRKFAPLVLGSKPLTAAMSTDEIADLSERLDDTHPRFDVKLVAQLAKWIEVVGPKHVHKWPNLEYQGPMYWKLAHTSMARWQKIAVLALTTEGDRGIFPGWDEDRGAFLWSKVEAALRKKKEYESKDYRDPSTVKAFFETYCDMFGQKVFEVEADDDSKIQDFWIKPLHGFHERKGTLSLNKGSIRELKMKRPTNMSQYQFNKMMAEQKALEEGLSNVADADLL